VAGVTDRLNQLPGKVRAMHTADKNIEWKTVVSVPEAARYLGVGRKMIYQLIDFGELRAARQGGKWLVEEDSVVAFRKSGKMT
jgi:excisionase family DNA binding protein